MQGAAVGLDATTRTASGARVGQSKVVVFEAKPTEGETVGKLKMCCARAFTAQTACLAVILLKLPRY